MKPLAAAFLVLLTVHLSAGEEPLRSGDRIELDITGVPADERAQIKGEYTIDDHGRLHLHLIGEIVAEGERPSTLAFKIEQTYVQSEMYTRPVMVVNPLQSAPQKTVSLIGGVKRPGPVTFTGTLSLVEALAKAEGFSEWALPDEVRITRGGKTTRHNVQAILQRKAEDIFLESGDQIEVPERKKKR